MTRRALNILAALGLLVATAAIAPSPAAADDGLVVTSHAVYEVRPEERAVGVVVSLAATNVTPDTQTEQVYYTGITLPLPLGASGVTVRSGGLTLPVALSTSEGIELADITFPAGLFYRQTLTFDVSFDLRDAGGPLDRETWVRNSFVAFGVWAYGTPGGTPESVEIVLPAGYAPSVHGHDLEITTTAEATRLMAEGIDDPDAFFSYVTAEREAERSPRRLEVSFADGPATVMLFAWPDDPEWSERQATILEPGLPALEREIGLPYPIIGVLSITEHAYQHLGDYAGFFLEGDDTIEMRFDADAFTALHEAAHVWFNGAISEDRWLVEGFASYYAEVVGTLLDEELVVSELTDEIARHRFPLVSWGGVGSELPEREDYGYAASHEVARRIAEAVGPGGLREVWRAADTGRRTYALSDDERHERGEPEPSEWQRLLDLFEIASGADLAPLWREWVVGDGHDGLLSERAEARAQFAETADALDDWPMPESTRILMGAWRFDDAVDELDDLGELVSRRETIEAMAGELGLTIGADVRAALEAAGIEAARREASLQTNALEAIAGATEATSRTPSPVEVVGLAFGTDPVTDLQEARAAFEAGDEADAAEEARAAVEALRTAADRGRLLVAASGGSILLADFAFLAWLLRRRRPA